MACITGGRRCERILTGGQTALDLWVFLHVIGGCWKPLDGVGITEVSREIYGILLVCGSNAGLSAREI